MKKIKKISLILLLILMLTGCTTVLKDKDGKVVKNTETGQNITKNILCRPNDEKITIIYEKNEVNLKELPKCTDLKISGKYDGLWTTFFVRPLAVAIIKLGTLVKSNILALVLITIIIRLILYPITKKTAMQSELIKKANPEISKIEKKYEGKTDNDSIMQKNQEIMIVYKKYKINPLSGCIFSIIQLPLLFAFLEAINRVPDIFEETILTIQMGTTPFIGIKTGNYLYIILPIIIILTTYFSFKMNKSTVGTPELEKQTNTMTKFMVVLIGFMSFTFGSAIGIYWITSSSFTILQNLITDRSKK